MLRRIAVASAVTWLLVFAARAATFDFVAAFRDGSSAYALTGGGDVYRFGGPSPAKLYTLADNRGGAYHWLNPPKSFVKWRGEWIVCDASANLLHFNEQGVFVRKTEVPVRTDKLTIAGDRLVLHSVVAATGGDQFWSLSPGAEIGRVPIVNTTRFLSPLDNLVVIAGGRHGEIYSAALIGPPTLHLVWPAGHQRDIPLAYSRTAARAAHEHPRGIVDDISPFSQPLRDLYALDDGGIVVLRNREDARSPNGKVEDAIGRRADRYDASGQHRATAQFATTVRWVTAVNDHEVSGVTKDGTPVSAAWGTPVEGVVLKP